MKQLNNSQKNQLIEDQQNKIVELEQQLKHEQGIIHYLVMKTTYISSLISVIKYAYSDTFVNDHAIRPNGKTIEQGNTITHIY